MLHPTLMPSTFNFNPFNSSQSLVNSPSPQFQGMEGLRGGLGAEDGGVAGEEFCVEELLDLSNGFSETEEELPEMEMELGNEKMAPVVELEGKREEAAAVEKQEFEALRGGELAVEAEGLESLEWLSYFVEDSFCDYSFAGKFHATAAAAAVEEQACFTIPVQTKARTKRARAGARVWPVLSSDSPTSSSSSTTSFPSAKKRKRKPGDGDGAAQPRRCSHCGVTKTPQWRAGPLGAKTLCNACGVRFKSGRLLPEYRPACSPTFSSELHSNNHRKVLEMRRKKEGAAGLPPPVQSF